MPNKRLDCERRDGGIFMYGIIALAAGYVLSQFYRSFLAVLTPALSADLGMSNNELSQALSAWFLVFAAAQFVVGPMLDRIGPRLTASILLIIGGGGGALLFAAATAGWMVIVAMGLIGLGCSPVLMGTFYIFRRVYSPARFAFLSSTFIAVGQAGNLLGASPLAWAAEVLGWRVSMLWLAAVTFLVGALLLLVIRDPAKEEGEISNGSYLDVLKIKVLWPILPLAFFNYAVIANMRGLWAGPYFDQVHGLSALQIGSITFYIAIAMIAGTFAYGPLDTLFNSRKKVILIGNLITVLALIVWVMDPFASVPKAAIILIVLGIAGSSYGVIMAHGLAFIPKNLTGRGSTLINFCSIGGGGFMQYASGFVYEQNAEPTALNGFSAVFWLYLACIAVAVTIYAFSKDKPPKEA